jgi:hydrogenase maturation protease
MSHLRVLVAGIGNVFFGDDGFGVEVARRLLERPQPEGVVVRDFGIRGRDLAYALLDGYDAAVLVDAAPRGGRPGTLYVIEPQIGVAGGGLADSHSLHPDNALALASAMGGPLPVLRVVGCEPSAGPDAEGMVMELSAPVAAAVAEAVAIVESLVAELREGVIQRA